MFSYQKLEIYNRVFLLNKSVYRLIKSNIQIPSYVSIN
jgi:hypothetical protein